MLDSLLLSLEGLLTIGHMSYLVLGVLLGISIGILPGLGGIVGFSIMLPFLYGMDQTSALALLIGLVAVIPTSDTFTSVLMGIPGSSASQATVLDGYPLSKKGDATRALSAAFASSLVGGLMGAIILTFVILFARPLILSFTSAELFALGMLGLSMVGVLSGSNIYKGFIACGVGLLIGAIGSAPATGEWRMSFGNYYLFDGVKLVIVGLGIFAIPEIVDLLVKNTRIAGDAQKFKLGKGWLRGLKDVWLHKWIVARCAPLGALIGAIPGLGGSVVDWIAYGHIVQTAKDKTQFGKGDIRGVIAPESANNAKEGGGLVPTLLFGIPGSGSMAVFLGGLTILGIETGPNLVGEDLNISYTIIWSLAIANVVGTLLCIALASKVARLTTIPYGFLGPFMIMIICFAAIQATRSIEDLILLLAIGVVGILFKYFNWSRPALLIGFVLSATIETYFYQAVQFYSWEFLTRTGVMVIIGFTIISVMYGNILYKKTSKTEDSQRVNTATFKKELFFIAGIVVFTLYALIDSMNNDFLGKVFPMSIAVLMIINLLFMIKELRSKKLTPASDNEIATMHAYWTLIWQNFLWFVLMIVMTWLFGFLVGLATVFIGIIRTKTNTSWVTTLLITGLAIGFLIFIQNIMTLHLPQGVLFSYE